jgi:hypothetical protein
MQQVRQGADSFYQQPLTANLRIMGFCPIVAGFAITQAKRLTVAISLYQPFWNFVYRFRRDR